jgi:hypothetical protein
MPWVGSVVLLPEDGDIEDTMHDYPIYDIESAPEKFRPALQGLKQNLGLVPKPRGDHGRVGRSLERLRRRLR